jgi:antitoxin component YwqK of YwqJK toxin-antitoxin module
MIKRWYENGQIMEESTYKNGALNGLSIKWVENGKSKTETNFINGKKDGYYREWVKEEKEFQLKEEKIYKEDIEIK